MSNSQYDIVHQSDEKLLYVAFDDGQRAFIRYKDAGANSAASQVDFYSTFVPETHRGQGIARKLVEHGFAWAKSQGLQIKASCWYAAKLLESEDS